MDENMKRVGKVDDRKIKQRHLFINNAVTFPSPAETGVAIRR